MVKFTLKYESDGSIVTKDFDNFSDALEFAVTNRVGDHTIMNC